ncbi:CoA transferase [Novosphingobium sp.]|jgi:crotonobetainyl-CoA:carnitine CoA-transferase CaiB-like acyl-CoA transferase|uniref:CaiB/BaiF CoA transferase family protein n=1 Tax=Novosphingobium sp. TaxID=1874826 RepID=UPI0022C971D5|nr:CoA transferase [Novosphingobium sp.]MCZ8019937.1 CoA transferase [Novosphingobium sp.]MCZ8033567.1 CoA transferase [Novosphingobium sp.]MCZ8050923.1 CoA transferase [Novosphingobium sp.]MCZ8059269.1 CoA transferase [Novosphingobium sp.]MCZ8231107.1 CoA transferase [Novosphingobium sp.]
MSENTPAPPMLQGIKVVDLTTVVFGPYCTQILADLGAEVIKVETPGTGDALRWAAKAPVTPGMSPAFFGFNHGKRSIALDLKGEADAAVMRALLAEADLFVVNVRGKALDRLGLDYEAVRAIRPDIVYVHCVGFGQDGPYADLQAYDDVIQAASGAASLLPRVDGNPRPRYLPSLIADKVAGLHAAYASLAALFHRQRTGEGQRVEVPMLEAFSSFMLNEHLGGQTFDPPVGPVGYQRQLDPDRQPFPTADGHVSIVAYTYDSWDRIFALLDDPDFLNDPRFEGGGARVANMAAMYHRIAELTPQLTTAELIARCQAAQIPAQPVRDIGAMLDDPHLAATGFFRRREHPSEGTYHEIGAPVRFGALPTAERSPPPLLDQDGAAIRAELAGKQD